MKKRIDVLLLALGLVALTACSWTRIINTNEQAQGITAPSPTVSPTPSAECALGSLQPGTAGDTREIAQGGTLGIGVSLFGPQGLPLVSSCLSLYSPAWTTIAGPCSFVGGHDGVASAPAAATLGATCTGGVDVGGKHGTLSLIVVP